MNTIKNSYLSTTLLFLILITTGRHELSFAQGDPYVYPVNKGHDLSRQPEGKNGPTVWGKVLKAGRSPNQITLELPKNIVVKTSGFAARPMDSVSLAGTKTNEPNEELVLLKPNIIDVTWKGQFNPFAKGDRIFVHLKGKGVSSLETYTLRTKNARFLNAVNEKRYYSLLLSNGAKTTFGIKPPNPLPAVGAVYRVPGVGGKGVIKREPQTIKGWRTEDEYCLAAFDTIQKLVLNSWSTDPDGPGYMFSGVTGMVLPSASMMRPAFFQNLQRKSNFEQDDEDQDDD